MINSRTDMSIAVESCNDIEFIPTIDPHDAVSILQCSPMKKKTRYGIALCYIVGQCVRVMCDVWIAWWADASSSDSNSKAPDQLERQGDTYVRKL